MTVKLRGKSFALQKQSQCLIPQNLLPRYNLQAEKKSTTAEMHASKQSEAFILNLQEKNCLEIFTFNFKWEPSKQCLNILSHN